MKISQFRMVEDVSVICNRERVSIHTELEEINQIEISLHSNFKEKCDYHNQRNHKQIMMSYGGNKINETLVSALPSLSQKDVCRD